MYAVVSKKSTITKSLNNATMVENRNAPIDCNELVCYDRFKISTSQNSAMTKITEAKFKINASNKAQHQDSMRCNKNYERLNIEACKSTLVKAQVLVKPRSPPETVTTNNVDLYSTICADFDKTNVNEQHILVTAATLSSKTKMTQNNLIDNAHSLDPYNQLKTYEVHAQSTKEAVQFSGLHATMNKLQWYDCC